MKTLTTAVCLALTALAVRGQTSSAYSANAVGFLQVVVPGEVSTLGRLTLASVALHPLGTGTNNGTMTLDRLIGTNLHANTSINNADQILLWSSNQYLTAFLNSTGGSDTNKWFKWCYLVGQARALCSSNAAFDIYPGRAFWVRNRGGSVTVTLAGEVPTMPRAAVVVNQGLSMLANPFPAAIGIQNLMTTNDSVFASTSINSADQLMFWTGTDYLTTFLNSTGGSDTAKWWKWCLLVGQSRVVATNAAYAGDGFWYRRRGAGSFIWSPEKPYAWP